MAKKKKYKSEDFFKLLKEANASSALSDLMPSAPVVFVSNDSLRIRRAITWLKESVPRLENTETITYFASDLNSKAAVAPIIQSLSSPSLFSKEQIILIQNANKLKAPALEELTLAVSKQYFSLLFLITDELNAALEKISTVVEFEEFPRPKLVKWIKKEFAELGFEEVEGEAVNYLADCFSGNLGELCADISKICLLSEEGQRIKNDFVRKIATTNIEASGFDLFTCISQGKVSGAQEKLLLMFKQGMHPLQVNAFLSRCFRTMASTKDSTKELSNPWFSSKIKNHSRSYSSRYLLRAISKIAESDFALKDSGLQHEDIMANMVMRFTTRS